MAKVSLRNVMKSFGSVDVLHGISCEIEDGEFAVIVGPSGCGKSTLLRLIAGLEALTAGDIVIGDRVVNRLEPKARNVAMVFQSYALYPHMTVFKNLAYSLRIARRPKKEIAARVDDVARILGLETLLHRKPAQLSGGQRQRVAMGRAIIRQPEVFLFDEPLSNLDAQLRGQMRVEIKRLHQRLQATSVFVTHDQVEAMTMADRLIVMNDGMIEQIGAPKAVYDRPSSTFVASFIGAPAMNFLSGQMREDGGAVELVNGTSLDVLADVYRAYGGKPVTVGIRPEHIHIGAQHEGLHLTAHLDLVEELGAGQLVYTSIAGKPLIVSVPTDVAWEPSEQVTLSVMPHRIHLFDMQSGARLTHE